MKKQAIFFAVAASLLGLSASGSAQQGPGPGGPDDGGPYALRPDRHDGPVPHHDWHPGEPVPPSYRGPHYVVDDWRAYELQPPPAGYQWLRVNGDFVLAAVTTGVITSILAAPHR
ncbi:RcnB family protein [Paraburkholderia sp.]|uniref:RcnB family protein n=1 Tax=Paraburkholderia sp. TaxID=1926495 RepID=UPI0039E6B3F6